MSAKKLIEVAGRALHMKRTLGLARAAKFCSNQGLPLEMAVKLLATR